MKKFLPHGKERESIVIVTKQIGCSRWQSCSEQSEKCQNEWRFGTCLQTLTIWYKDTLCPFQKVMDYTHFGMSMPIPESARKKIPRWTNSPVWIVTLAEEKSFWKMSRITGHLLPKNLIQMYPEEEIVQQRTPISNWRAQKKFQHRHWAQIEVQMRVGNLNAIKLFTIVIFHTCRKIESEPSKSKLSVTMWQVKENLQVLHTQLPRPF